MEQSLALVRSSPMTRWHHVAMAAVALAIGAAVLVYRGPARELVRGHVGDVAATLLVFALLGLVWRARPATRALVTLAIATAIELGQTIWSTRSLAGELVLGNTFDPYDLVAYALGVGIALAWELRCAHATPRALAGPRL